LILDFPSGEPNVIPFSFEKDNLGDDEACSIEK
jgi:hypothetical protein